MNPHHSCLSPIHVNYSQSLTRCQGMQQGSDLQSQPGQSLLSNNSIPWNEDMAFCYSPSSVKHNFLSRQETQVHNIFGKTQEERQGF